LLHEQYQSQSQYAATNCRCDEQDEGRRTILLERNQRRRDDPGVGDLQTLLFAGFLRPIEKLLE